MEFIFSKLITKSSYKSVYGKKAKVSIVGDIVEVLIGNRKIIHDKKTSCKREETIFEGDKMKIVKYNESGKPELEEVYIDNKKIEEASLDDGKSTSITMDKSGLETSKTKQLKNGIEVVETIYKYSNELTKVSVEVIVIEEEDEILTSISRSIDGDSLEVLRRTSVDGKLLFYKVNDLEIELDYFDDSSQLKYFSKHWEEPVFEEVSEPVAKGKKGGKSSKEPQVEPVKKQVGTKVMREIIEFNSFGNIVKLNTNEDDITKEFYEDGSLKLQYKIIETGEKGKGIVGVLIDDSGELKIINNSEYTESMIDSLNQVMESVDVRYKDKNMQFYDYLIVDGQLCVVETHYKLNSKLTLDKKVYDVVENNVNYIVEEIYDGEMLLSTRYTNKLSGTEFYVQDDIRKVKCINGIESEVSQEEFDLYKMADALNKLEI